MKSGSRCAISLEACITLAIGYSRPRVTFNASLVFCIALLSPWESLFTEIACSLMLIEQNAGSIVALPPRDRAVWLVK